MCAHWLCDDSGSVVSMIFHRRLLWWVLWWNIGRLIDGREEGRREEGRREEGRREREREEREGGREGEEEKEIEGKRRWKD